MKKDFTQPLVSKPATLHLLLQDEPSGVFLVERHLDEDKENDGYYAEDFYFLPNITVVDDSDYALELTKKLAAWGLSPIMFEELVRTTKLDYSLGDETPGTSARDIYLHVTVDVAANAKHSFTPLPLNKLSDYVTEDPSLSRALRQLGHG